METNHQIFIQDARNLSQIPDKSTQLIVTSPPYPMIEMWDKVFGSMSKKVKNHLRKGEGNLAFEAMHLELDKVWKECFRILDDGCFACINIGDATRTLNKQFQMYSNHSRIIMSAMKAGFQVLPDIIWHKPTNATTKFMGSGMLPAGAYIKYEHEYILIFRKGGKRVFDSQQEKENRLLPLD